MSYYGVSGKSFSLRSLFRSLHLNPSLLLFLLILSALIAFEMFNYSTTEHALSDLLGSLEFAGLRWATILAFAFCGIDFAGIARIFTPEQGIEEPKEIWYLFGAWLLAATMNAMLTWWGVSMAIASHTTQSAAILDRTLVTKGVPVFVAILVWVIRILIIGTLTMAGERVLWGRRRTAPVSAGSHRPVHNPTPSPRPLSLNNAAAVSRGLLNRTAQATSRPPLSRASELGSSPSANPLHSPEPTYHSLNGAGQRPPQQNGSDEGTYQRRL
jgi:hypothetical protein